MASEIPLFGALAVDCQNQHRMLDTLVRQRPWIRAVPASHRGGVPLSDLAEQLSDDQAGRAAVLGDRFNILFTDRRIINVGFGAESVFSLLSSPHAAGSAPDPAVPTSATMSDLAPYQLINHMPGNAALTSKANLIRSLNRQYVHGDTAVFDVVPMTYFIHSGTRTRSEAESPVLQQFLKRFAASALIGARAVADANVTAHAAVRMPARQCERNLWIVKASTHSKGYYPIICASSSDVKGALLAMHVDAVVQKYVERPMLVSGHKLSLRMFVLVNDSLDVFIGRYVVCMLAPNLYVLDAPPSSSDPAAYEAYMRGHMTNATDHMTLPPSADAVPSVLSLSGLQGYIDQEFQDVFPPDVIAKVVIPRMKRVVIDAVRGASAAPMSLKTALGFGLPSHTDSAALGLSSEARDALQALNLRAGHRGRRCFELLSAEFVLDEDLRPWLLGFKENPRLSGYDETTDLRIGESVDQLLRMVVDPLFVSLSSASVMAAHHASTTFATMSPSGSPRGPSELSQSLSEAQVYASAASNIPTGPAALSAMLHAQAMGRQQHDSLQFDTLHPAALRFFAAEMGAAPSKAAAVPSHWELVYRTMSADDMETPQHVDATLLAMKVAVSAFDIGVAMRVHGNSDGSHDSGHAETQLATALPPRARATDTIPAFAYRGVRNDRVRLTWYRNGMGLQAGDVVVEQHVHDGSKLPDALRVPDIPGMHGERIMSAHAFSMAVTPPRPATLDSGAASTRVTALAEEQRERTMPKQRNLQPVPTPSVAAMQRLLTPAQTESAPAPPSMTLAGKLLAEFDDVHAAALLKSKATPTPMASTFRSGQDITATRTPRSQSVASRPPDNMSESLASEEDGEEVHVEDDMEDERASSPLRNAGDGSNRQVLMKLLEQLAASTEHVAKLQKQLASRKAKLAAKADAAGTGKASTSASRTSDRREMKSLSVREIRERAAPRVDTGQKRIPQQQLSSAPAAQTKAVSTPSSASAGVMSLAHPAAPLPLMPAFMRGTAASRERVEEVNAATMQHNSKAQSRPWRTSHATRALVRTQDTSSPERSTDTAEDSMQALHRAVLDAQARMQDTEEALGRTAHAGRTPFEPKHSKRGRTRKLKSARGQRRADDGDSLEGADEGAHEAAARLLEELIAADARDQEYLATHAAVAASSGAESADTSVQRPDKRAAASDTASSLLAGDASRSVRFANTLTEAAKRTTVVAGHQEQPPAPIAQPPTTYALAEFTSIARPRFDAPLYGTAGGAPERLLAWTAPGSASTPEVGPPAVNRPAQPRIDATSVDIRNMAAKDLMTPDASQALGMYDAILRGVAAASPAQGSTRVGPPAAATAATARGRGAVPRAAPTGVGHYPYSDVVDSELEPQLPSQAVTRRAASSTTDSSTFVLSTSPQAAAAPTFRFIQSTLVPGPEYGSLMKAYSGEGSFLRTPEVLVSAVQSLEAAAPFRPRSASSAVPVSSTDVPGVTSHQDVRDASLTVRARAPQRVIFQGGGEHGIRVPGDAAASAYLSSAGAVPAVVSRKPQLHQLDTRLPPTHDRVALLQAAPWP